MGIEPVDRRVRKTRRQLRECLITLLKEKKVQDITVRELTDMADLNRGTFYLHYKDVFDLLEKTEAELQEDFNQLVCKHDAVDLKQRPSVIFNEIYSLVYDNADLIEILLGENGDLNFVNRLKDKLIIDCNIGQGVQQLAFRKICGNLFLIFVDKIKPSVSTQINILQGISKHGQNIV